MKAQWSSWMVSAHTQEGTYPSCRTCLVHSETLVRPRSVIEGGFDGRHPPRRVAFLWAAFLWR